MIYRDASLGNLVHVSVAKLLILKVTTTMSDNLLLFCHWCVQEEETFTPASQPSSSSASDMLKSFCKWQTRLNQYKDDGPVHYDVALLLTRYLSIIGELLSKEVSTFASCMRIL